MKLIEIDKKTGKFRLSMKALLEKPEGWEERAPRAPRRDGGNRDNNHNNRMPRRDDNRMPRRDDRRDNRRRDDRREFTGQRFEHRNNNREEQQPQAADGHEEII